MEIKEILSIMQNVEMSKLLLIPFIFMVLDLLTGSVNAWKNGDFKSSKMRSGLAKKTAEITLIIIGACLLVIGLPNYILYFIIGWVILMELISLCENINKMGLELPGFISKGLEQTKENYENYAKEVKEDDNK